VLQIAGGGTPLRNRWLAAALAGIWGLAAWSLLSALWADSPAAALEGGTRNLFYAALVTIPVVMVAPGRMLWLLGRGVILGISVIAVLTLIRLLAGEDDLFLAGRLNGPVEYRNATALLFSLAFWPLIVTAAYGPQRLLRASAFALAELCLGLAFLTQSRGIIFGLAAGGLVVLALGPERIRRAWLAIVAAVGIAVFS